MDKYDHKKIEKKWQKFWAEHKIYTTPDQAPGKENFYLLVEFPYPSGNLHVGHWYAFAVPDIRARFERMKGKNVLYPIGFDAFGLPAENAAIKNKLNPRKWTESNIAYMTKQIESMGTSFDWSRKVSTIDPEYYKWTQWLFLQLYKKGLAYQKETAVNWCPKDKTVLANEQVINGRCERCESEVVQKMMLQWNIKITDYADRSIDDLEKLDWPQQIKDSQRNWIGRSEGAEIDFPLIIKEEKKLKYVILHGFEGSPDLPRWQWIKRELESLGHEVIIPRLPGTEDPREKDQVKVAIEATSYDEQTVLVGHSLGAVVALKVLEQLKQPILRTVLIGGFIDTNFKDHARAFEKLWIWKFDGKAIRSNSKIFQVLHDPRDYAVKDEQANALAKMLGTEVLTGNSVEPHFTGNIEPDVLMWLRPTIRVFTTRADTLFGATYLVLAPEHPWVTLALGHETVFKNNAEVEKYVQQSKKKTELERQMDTKEKTGVELKGVKAINPATGEKIPVWVADYVLGHYGTGAVMAVPAHDERDHEFAKKFNLPIKQVVARVVRGVSGPDAVQPGMKFKERNAAMAIVKHWEKDEYLCLQWKGHDVRTFVSGGIHEGERPQDTCAREIREETGFTHPKFIRQLGDVSCMEFYHQAKEENVRAYFTYLYFELTNGEQVPVSDEEKAKHDYIWKNKGELEEFLTISEGRRILGLIDQKKESAYTGDGYLIHSGEFNRQTVEEGKKAITEKFGRAKKTYKLRDWIVSRQRYWGVPIPIIHCPKCGTQAVPDKDLPVKLPEVKDYLPDGRGHSPLAKAKKWVAVKCPKCKGKAERETDTLDTFVDSSWYFLRYTDPKNKKKFADAKKMAHWMPVDLYSGGAEHTTMHVLYSRFWQKALLDLGLVDDSEPYTKRENHGLVLGSDGQKMSKSRGNVMDPDELVAKVGSDTIRLYLAFMGPYTGGASYPWNPNGVVGVRRFLERVWRLQDRVVEEEMPSLEPKLHRTIRKIEEDIEVLKFNTAIAQLMIFLNQVEEEKQISRSQWRRFLLLLSPFAPHLTEELWNRSGHHLSIHRESWPVYDPRHLEDAFITIAVQINGKTRGTVHVPLGADNDALTAAARENVATRLLGKKIGRTIVVPRRLVNFVLED